MEPATFITFKTIKKISHLDCNLQRKIQAKFEMFVVWAEITHRHSAYSTDEGMQILAIHEHTATILGE